MPLSVEEKAELRLWMRVLGMGHDPSVIQRVLRKSVDEIKNRINELLLRDGRMPNGGEEEYDVRRNVGTMVGL